MNISISNPVRFFGVALAGLMFVALPFTFVAKAHAADLGDYGYDTYDYGGGYDTYDYGSSPSYDYSPDTYDTYSYSPDTYDTYSYSPDTYSSPSYDYGNYGCSSCSTASYPSYDYGTGYGYTGCSSCSTPSYSYDYPSYDYSSGYGYVPPTYTPPVYTPPSIAYVPPSTSNTNTNVNTTTDTNTCTTNSCNTTISTPINAPTTVTITNPNNNSTPNYVPVYQPVPVYQAPQQPVYTPTIYNNPRPVAYNQPAPYVSLTQVPYTGLDLGPVGTALYWGFLALWCLGAAYLLAVKRVQNKLVAKLFGKKATQNPSAQKSSDLLTSPSGSAGQTFARQASAPHAPASKFGNIDPFIASQLSKLA